MIDPGHGGPDPGAIGIGGLREADVVLDVSKRVKKLLSDKGVMVRLTRNNEISTLSHSSIWTSRRNFKYLFLNFFCQ